MRRQHADACAQRQLLRRFVPTLPVPGNQPVACGWQALPGKPGVQLCAPVTQTGVVADDHHATGIAVPDPQRRVQGLRRGEIQLWHRLQDVRIKSERLRQQGSGGSGAHRRAVEQPLRLPGQGYQARSGG